MTNIARMIGPKSFYSTNNERPMPLSTLIPNRDIMTKLYRHWYTKCASASFDVAHWLSSDALTEHTIKNLQKKHCDINVPMMR